MRENAGTQVTIVFVLFWVVMRHHQYGISALVSQTSFCQETTGDVAKCRLLSQATIPKARRIAERKQKTFIGGNTHSTETFQQLDFQTRCLEIRQIVFQISFVTS